MEIFPSSELPRGDAVLDGPVPVFSSPLPGQVVCRTGFPVHYPFVLPGFHPDDGTPQPGAAGGLRRLRWLLMDTPYRGLLQSFSEYYSTLKRNVKILYKFS